MDKPNRPGQPKPKSDPTSPVPTESPKGQSQPSIPSRPADTPPELVEQIQPIARAFAQQMKVEIAPAKDPLVEQITGEHLTQILTAQLKKQDQLH
jgi:hypothetical protein